MELKKLMEHISIIPDYRQAWKVEHKLSDILLLTICAVIAYFHERRSLNNFHRDRVITFEQIAE